MTAIADMPGLTLAFLCAGEMLRPKVPVRGEAGPLPADWAATADVPPRGTHIHPFHIGQQWVQECNFVAPSQVPMNCPAVWAWRCQYGHVWVENIRRRLLSPECPHCSKVADDRQQRRKHKPLDQLVAEVPTTPNFPTHATIWKQLKAHDNDLAAKVVWHCRAPWKMPHEPFELHIGKILLEHWGCPSCWKRPHFMPSEQIVAGDAFYSYSGHAVSKAEGDLRRALMPLVPVDGTVNAVRIGDDWFGKPMVYPDILLPSLKIAVEYDGTGSTTHLNDRGQDKIKDEILRDVGWLVIRVCQPPVQPLHRHDIVVGAGEDMASVASKVADAVTRLASSRR